MATFPRFLDLPTEIRLLVWTYSLLPKPREPPRTLELDRKYCKCEPNRTRSHLGFGDRFYTRKPAPAILHTCHEARSIGLCHYRKAFHCGHPAHSAHFVWVDFDVDVIRMTVDHVGSGKHGDLNLIQRLQLYSDDKTALDFIEFGLEYLDYSALKSVDIIHDGPMKRWYSQLYEPCRSHWGCAPPMIRVISKDGGEVLDYERDKELYTSGAWLGDGATEGSDQE